MTTADDIDALLAAAKLLAGQPSWSVDERGTVARIAAPIAAKGVVGRLVLRAQTPLHTEIQRGSCALVFDDGLVQRFSFKPDHAHLNPRRSDIPREIRGSRLPPDISRIHPWRLNRVWPGIGDNLAVAEPMDREPSSFSDALTIFMHLCAISGELAPAPWEPRLL
jgi:hypothetical protein